jgi:hypothetical protein
MADASKVSLFCKKTKLSERFDPGALATISTHPTFEIKIEFDESRKKKFFKCPHCGKEISYQAFRYEFRTKGYLRWPLILIGAGVALFFAGVFLGMGGLSMNQVGWTAIVGFMLFALGLTWLLVLLMTYFFFYRKDRTRYIFRILGLSGSGHLLPSWKLGGRWKSPPPVIA